jgi:hypothetical protein
MTFEDLLVVFVWFEIEDTEKDFLFFVLNVFVAGASGIQK